MKLNFWQWLAVVLLIIGGAWWAYDLKHPKDNPTGSTNIPATQSTSTP
jgi:hypothetical protein